MLSITLAQIAKSIKKGDLLKANIKLHYGVDHIIPKNAIVTVVKADATFQAVCYNGHICFSHKHIFQFIQIFRPFFMHFQDVYYNCNQRYN